jgi:hypothetical protein
MGAVMVPIGVPIRGVLRHYVVVPIGAKSCVSVAELGGSLVANRTIIISRETVSVLELIAAIPELAVALAAYIRDRLISTAREAWNSVSAIDVPADVRLKSLRSKRGRSLDLWPDRREALTRIERSIAAETSHWHRTERLPAAIIASSRR